MKHKELFAVEKIREMARRAAPRVGRATVRLGIGDDAAVLAGLSADQELLVTTDLLIEGSHFYPDQHPARAVGHKLLARGLSDIAAMGGRPLYALLSLCLPRWAGPGWQRQFFGGLFRLARRFGVVLVGGDLAAGRRFAADIVVLGSARRGCTLERGRAKTGDIVFVSGRLGGSAVGFERLQIPRRRGPDAAVRRHLYPEPRIALGRRLVELGARAAIDLSDGLSLDLHRLAAESGVGAAIRAADIPLHPGASLGQALHGGEDYELLFTMGPSRRPPRSFQGLPITPIGELTRGRRLVLIGPGGRRGPLPVRGFQHNVRA